MGRAIEMEKDIDMLKSKVNEIFLILDEISKVGTKQEHVDIHEETKQEKTNNEGSGKSSGKSNSGKSKAKTASNNNSTNSK
jgi:hypothetical protein